MTKNNYFDRLYMVNVMQILFCNDLLSVRIVYLLKTFINIIRFVIPIVLILKTAIDIYKGVISTDDKGELIKNTSNRI